MRNSKSFRFHAPFATLGAGHRVIATFGAARLIRKPNGQHELVGGTRDNHADALQWCSMFHHDLVFSSVLRRNPTIAFVA